MIDMYESNINKIDNQLKNIFTGVKINNSDYRQLEINLSEPTGTNESSNIEMKLFISQKNLNNIDPIVEWGYYTNPLDVNSHIIRFNNTIDKIPSILEEIVSKRRLDKSYLEQRQVLINESNINTGTDTDVSISHINESYNLSESDLKIYENKFRSYLYTLGLVVDGVSISYKDSSSGKIRGKSMFDDPRRGDEPIMELNGISSKRYSGNIRPKDWILLENEMRKLPFVEDVNSNTYNHTLNVTFSTKVYVGLN